MPERHVAGPAEPPAGMERRLVVAGAGGRDFHDFATVFRDDPGVRVVAFTAAQIPYIDRRVFPAALAGPRYPDGIPIRPEAELDEVIAGERVDEVVLAYSDLSHEEVMHLASRVLAAGAGFRLLAPARTMLSSRRPVVAVVAARTGAGKSPVSRRIGALLSAGGVRVGLIRHPMPYGDLGGPAVQRFASLADIDAAGVTLEEREEYEEPVRLGLVVYAGIDYRAVLDRAEAESDVIVWDGGNNDTPFVAPDVTVCVLDALRPGHERTHHPGETNLRMADVVVVNKVDGATGDAIARIEATAAELAPGAPVVRCASPVTLDEGPSLVGRRVLVIEDGPTITHGGMVSGAGAVAARRAGAAELVDPRGVAVGSMAAVYAAHPHIGSVLPAMGYRPEQLAELGATARAAECDVVVTGTPVDLARLVDLGHPVRRARYEVVDAGRPTLDEALAPWLDRWLAPGPTSS